jgi:hypothetical protein
VVDDHEALLRCLADGLISEWHLRMVVAATEDLTPAHKDLVARQLAVQIRARHTRGTIELTPYKLAHAAARLVIAVDPDAATRRCERARRRREVSVTARRDGACALWVKGPAEQTQHMYDTVQRDARTRRHDGDDRDLHTIMYDHIYDTLTGLKPWAGPDPIPHPDPEQEPDPEHDDGGDGYDDWKHDEPAPSNQQSWHHEEAPASSNDADEAPTGAGTQHKQAQAASNGDSDADAEHDPDTPATDGAAETAETSGVSGRRWRQRVRYLAPGDLDPDDPVLDTSSDDAHSTDPAAGAGRRPSSGPVLTRQDHHLQIQIVMSAATLLGLDEQPALLRGYGAIPAEIARRIADTTTTHDPGTLNIRRLFCDPVDGRLLTMDTHTRRFTGPLRAFAIYRDQDCNISGATIRDIDHIRPHRHHGPTSANNGQGLARNAHVLRDHPHAHVSTRPPTTLLNQLRHNAPDIDWTMPSGRTYTSEPPPALGHGATSRPLTSLLEIHLEDLTLRHQDPD